MCLKTKTVVENDNPGKTPNIVKGKVDQIYIYANEELAKSFRKWHQFLIILATSWLSIFLGWLLYQFFPIFANG